jgi:hypothetical protein
MYVSLGTGVDDANQAALPFFPSGTIKPRFDIPYSEYFGRRRAFHELELKVGRNQSQRRHPASEHGQNRSVDAMRFAAQAAATPR